MDNSNILATLAKLEESIAGIDSAKKQVDDVVKSNGEAKKAFDDLAKSMPGVKKCVDDVLKAIEEKSESLDSESKTILARFQPSCNAILDKTEAALESVRKSMENGVEKSVTRLNGAIDALSSCVQPLNQLKDEISNAVNQVSEMRTELKSVETNLKNEFAAKSESIEGKIEAKSADVSSKIESKSAEISSAIDAKAEVILNSQSDHDKKLKDLALAISAVKAEEKKTQDQIAILLKQQKATKAIAIITMILVILGVAVLKFA